MVQLAIWDSIHGLGFNLLARRIPTRIHVEAGFNSFFGIRLVTSISVQYFWLKLNCTSQADSHVWNWTQLFTESTKYVGSVLEGTTIVDTCRFLLLLWSTRQSLWSLIDHEPVPVTAISQSISCHVCSNKTSSCRASHSGRRDVLCAIFDGKWPVQTPCTGWRRTCL